MVSPERFSNLPDYAFPRLRKLLSDVPPGPDPIVMTIGERIVADLRDAKALPGVGLVAVGSRDANRFFPGMGTLFLRMMGEALAAALQRFPHG